MKKMMILFASSIFIIFISCKEKKGKVAIYPLNIYSKTTDNKNDINNTLQLLSFVVYHMDESKVNDSNYIKEITKPFIDSILLNTPQAKYEMQFYKKSKKIDTTFKETHNNLLYTIENIDDLILEYSNVNQPHGKEKWDYPQAQLSIDSTTMEMSDLPHNN